MARAGGSATFGGSKLVLETSLYGSWREGSVMILVDAKGVTMSRPGRELFSEISLTISTGERLALVGLNGTGKTTLVDVLTGARTPEVGTVVHGRGIRVATLDQNPDLGTGTICLLYTSPSPRDATLSRMPSSA